MTILWTAIFVFFYCCIGLGNVSLYVMLCKEKNEDPSAIDMAKLLLLWPINMTVIGLWFLFTHESHSKHKEKR